MSERWGVWCVVDGGHIGHREDWLHAGIERKIWMGNQSEAQAEATRLNEREKTMHSVATFTYQARKVPMYLD